MKDLVLKFPWLGGLTLAASRIVNTLFEKEQHYGGSWQARGGVGAFMMMCRKWDRIEKVVGQDHKYDVFEALQINTGDVMDDVDDLIGYLLLIRARHDIASGGPSEVPGVISTRTSGPTWELSLEGIVTEPDAFGYEGFPVINISEESAHMLLDHKVGSVLNTDPSRNCVTLQLSAK